MSNLIERQLAVNAIEKCHKKCCRVDANGDEWIHYETTLNEIECVVVAEQTAYWKHIGIDETDDRYRGWMPWYCSNCGYGVGKHYTRYCPDCGRRMIEKGGENA